MKIIGNISFLSIILILSCAICLGSCKTDFGHDGLDLDWPDGNNQDDGFDPKLTLSLSSVFQSGATLSLEYEVKKTYYGWRYSFYYDTTDICSGFEVTHEGKKAIYALHPQYSESALVGLRGSASLRLDTLSDNSYYTVRSYIQKDSHTYYSAAQTFMATKEPTAWKRCADRPISGSFLYAKDGILYFKEGTYQFQVYAYTPQTNTWKQLTTKLNAENIVLVGNVLYGATYEGLVHIDPVTHQTTLLRHDSLWGRTSPYLFTDGTSLYIGGGRSYSYEYKNDLWKYSPVLRSWQKLATVPFSLSEGATTFSATVSGKGYVYISDYDSTYNLHKTLWEYEPSTDQWTKRSLPTIDGSYSFSSDGEDLYASSDKLLKYSLSTDSWTTIDNQLPTKGSVVSNGRDLFLSAYNSKYFWKYAQ